MAFRWCACWAMCAVLLGCGDDSRPSGDTGPRVDTTVSDTGRDAPMGCTSDPDCDDGHECTIDMCGIGNVCRYTALDERCADGEMCLLGRGCASGCENNGDCDDGDFCNGPERCIMTPTGGECFDSLDPADCNDGNECTIDTCSMEVNGCVYETAEGCDAGVTGTDGGVPPDPFDPDVHYEGTFRLSPNPSLGCSSAEYNIAEAVFSVVDGNLRVTAGRFTLTQTPKPTGPSFAVSGSDGTCSSVRLSGTFEHADRFTGGMWSTTCGLCGTLNFAVTGRRR